MLLRCVQHTTVYDIVHLTQQKNASTTNVYAKQWTVHVHKWFLLE